MWSVVTQFLTQSAACLLASSLCSPAGLAFSPMGWSVMFAKFRGTAFDGSMALLLAVVSAIVARRGTDIRSTLIAESEVSPSEVGMRPNQLNVSGATQSVHPYVGVRRLLRRLGSAAYATEPRQAPTATGRRR